MKKIKVLMISLALCSAMNFVSYARYMNFPGGWNKDENGTWFSYIDGTVPSSIWLELYDNNDRDYKLYYVNQYGYRVENTSIFNGKYSFDANGVCTNASMDTVYNSSSWCADDKGMWYKNEDGTYPKNGQILVDDIIYYAGTDGYMLREHFGRDLRYYDSACQQDYYRGDIIYYLSNDVRNGYTLQHYYDNPIKNPKNPNAAAYKASLGNKWERDNKGWWWKNQDGTYPISSWKKIDGKYYYFGADGYLLVNTTTPDGYKVGSDGTWDQSVSKQTEINNNQNDGEAFSNLVYPVDVLGCGFTKNSVDGISPVIAFRNNSGKTIKYIDFEMTPYNAVDDPVKCSIRGYSKRVCEATGPYEPDEGICTFAYSITSGPIIILGAKTDNPYYYTTRSNQRKSLDKLVYGKTFSHAPSWDCVWYNSTIHYIRVTKVDIEYMDGTKDSMSVNVLLFNDTRL